MLSVPRGQQVREGGSVWGAGWGHCTQKSGAHCCKQGRRVAVRSGVRERVCRGTGCSKGCGGACAGGVGEMWGTAGCAGCMGWVGVHGGGVRTQEEQSTRGAWRGDVCARGIGHMGCMCVVHSCVCRSCGVLSWVGRVLRGPPPMWHGPSCRPRSLSPRAVRFCLSITAVLQCPEVWGAAFQLWRGGCSSLGAASHYPRAGGPSLWHPVAEKPHGPVLGPALCPWL